MPLPSPHPSPRPPHAVAAKYAGQQGKFTCFNKERVIDVASINDDYCDCTDGSDEPGARRRPLAPDPAPGADARVAQRTVVLDEAS